RRDAPGDDGLRGVPEAPRRGHLDAGADADGTRCRRGPGCRARRRSRRLPDEAFFAGRAVRAAACARPSWRRGAADRARRRRAPARPRLASGLARREGGSAVAEGVRADGDLHAPPRAGVVATAVARACVGLRIREPLERRRRLRALPEAEARQRRVRDRTRCRLQACGVTLRLRIRLTLLFSLAMAGVLSRARWFCGQRG